MRLVDVSDQQLVTILGQDLPRPIEAIGSLVTAPLPIKPDFHVLAVQTPAYFQHRAQVDAAAAGITIAQSAFYPTLGVDLTGTRGGAVLFPHQNSASSRPHRLLCAFRRRTKLLQCPGRAGVSALLAGQPPLGHE